MPHRHHPRHHNTVQMQPHLTMNTEQSEWVQDYNISGAKIEPLKSPTKMHSARGDEGVIGTDADIAHAHLKPLDSMMKHHHHTAAHADSQGVCGREETIQSSKIAPMDGKMKQTTEHTQGLDDETVDTARIMPMGEVRED